MRRAAWWFGWGTMTLLALGVSGYGLAFLLDDGVGSPEFQRKYATMTWAPFAHIGGGLIALSIGPFQFLAGLRRRALGLHRALGAVYVLAVLVGGMGGLRLSFSAHGGLWAGLGFGLLAVLWIATAGLALRGIHRGRIEEHRVWILRNFSLTYAAVTLRLYIPLALGSGAAFEDAFRVIAWACWVPNLLIAELVFVRRGRPATLAAQGWSSS